MGLAVLRKRTFFLYQEQLKMSPVTGRDAESSWKRHGRQACLGSTLRSGSTWKSTQGLPKAAEKG